MPAWIVDVAEEEFSEKVVESSYERPVVVDFWAPWCAPCRMLTPVLEKLAGEFEGAFILARVNTEDAPLLASQFQIQSIPFVLLLKNGEPVDSFVGVLPESEVKQFLRRYCATPVDRMVSLAQEETDRGEWEAAKTRLQQVLAEEPAHAGARLQLARIAWKEGHVEQAESCLKEIDPLSEQSAEAAILKAQIRFHKECDQFGGIEACGERVEKAGDDLESKYRLGCCLAAQGRYREALDHLLAIVARDRTFRSEAPRKAMLDIFQIVGVRSPLSEEYRSRLSRTIF